MPPKTSAYPYRRSSNASEKDFFDIPDESLVSIAKRQLRRLRTWAAIAILLIFILWHRHERPPPLPLPHIHYDEVDWSRFAYTQYATNEVYLCNSLMVFEALERLGSKAERVLFYPEQWDLIVENDVDRVSELLLMARNKYRVMVIPIKIDGVPDDNGKMPLKLIEVYANLLMYRYWLRSIMANKPYETIGFRRSKLRPRYPP
jgi:hypothetical protein